MITFLTSRLQGKITPLIFTGCYLVLMYTLHSFLRPDQLFLIFALTAVALLGRGWGKRFIIDWAPFTLFIIIYDGMRGIADGALGHINVRAPFMLEKMLFGWFSDGRILPFALQWWRHSLDGNVAATLNSISAFFYSIHFIAPFVFGWILWHTLNDRRGFYTFAYSLTILNILALITFFLYPAAPPWYVWKYHFAVPSITAFGGGDPGVLIKFDQLIRFPLFSSVYNALLPNAFAAIPSLHGSYPVMIAYFAIKRWKNSYVRTSMFIYVSATWLAACYLNHHYIIDLLIGAIYVVASITLYRYALGPYVIEPLVFKNKKREESFNNKAGEERSIVSTVLFGSGGIILIILLLAHARGYL